jgi:hypothetical protein
MSVIGDLLECGSITLLLSIYIRLKYLLSEGADVRW